VDGRGERKAGYSLSLHKLEEDRGGTGIGGSGRKTSTTKNERYTGRGVRDCWKECKAGLRNLEQETHEPLEGGVKRKLGERRY